jgi:L-seryl-tRNA(Ser) seleniumtransferase
MAVSARRPVRFAPHTKPLAQLLVESGDIQVEQVNEAILVQEQQGGLLGQILRQRGTCTDEVIVNALLKQMQVTDIQCEEIYAPLDVLKLVPREQCDSEKLCPFERLGKLLCVVMGNPLNRSAINAIEEATNLKVKPFKAPWPRIKDLLERSYSRIPASAAAAVALAAKASQSGGVQRVINATGVILHSGLGRSLLADAVFRDISAELRGYANVEVDLKTGECGDRDEHIAGMLCRLLGCEAATVVNNSAAATMLVLTALAKGREVIISRGQLMDIGSAFRVPDVMALSGAKMVEIGSTNRTHLRDYERAITPETGLIMLAYTSNYRVIGFTQHVEIGELAELGHQHNIPVFHDVGSGCLLGNLASELPGEPIVKESLTAGADVVCCSGDRILGGPQSGILLGRKNLIGAIRMNPLWRALRLDKLILRALQSTLALYFDPEQRNEALPTLRLLRKPLAELEHEAATLAERIVQACPSLKVDTAADTSHLESESLPERNLPTRVVRLTHPEFNAGELAAFLRMVKTPVIARIQDGHVLIDPRTLLDGEADEVIDALRESLT